jgi:hypothetical protein
MKYSSLFFLPVLFIFVSCWQQAQSSDETVSSSTSIAVDTLKPFGRYLHFDTIPVGGKDILSPGRGAYSWSGQYHVEIPYLPVALSQTAPLDAYYRFWWAQFEDSVKNNYNWSAFDEQIDSAISKRQKFSFCIMPTCPVCETKKISGATMHYPLWLHNAMQSETAKDWISLSSNMWEPNWNSNTYLSAWKSLNVALNAHIDSASYKGVAYKNVIYFIDASGFGSYGEWQNSFVIKNSSDYPEGTQPSAATLDSLIAYQLHVYNKYWVVALPGVWDGNQLSNTLVPPEVGYWASTAKNDAGLLGYRRDNFGDISKYIDNKWGINNPVTYKGISFDTVIRNRYKYAPVTGEPIQDGGNPSGELPCDYAELANQIKKYHVTSFGNGNYNAHSLTCMQYNVVAASKACGYRLQIKSGSISSVISTDSSFAVMLNWSNIGIAPTYENWNVEFELRNEKTVVQKWVSAFSPKLFLPGTKSVTDHFQLSPSTAAGNYSLYIIIRDPNGYRQPLPLANTNMLNDGSYLISKLNIVSSGKK